MRPLAGLVLAVPAAVALVGCTGDGSELVVLNRTTIPLVLEQSDSRTSTYPRSTLVVDACTERTIMATGDGWGGRPHESVRPGDRVDREAPESKAGPIDPATDQARTSIDCVATDDRGVVIVHLWRRFRPQATDGWGPWTADGVQPACPFATWLDAGVGYYEFATVAGDRAGNREALPAVGDVAIQRLPGATPSPTGEP